MSYRSLWDSIEGKGELISRDALLESLANIVLFEEKDKAYTQIVDLINTAPAVETFDKISGGMNNPYNAGYMDGIRRAYKDLERPEGSWVDVNGDGSLWRCDRCGEQSCCKGNYCPDCGATMGKDL